MKYVNAFIKECKAIYADAWLKTLLFWVPFILGGAIWAIFSVGIAHDLPIGVIDNDNSSVSRGLIRSYNASPTLQVSQYYQSLEQASDALKDGSIYAIIVIPYALEKNTYLGKTPQVTTFYNSQFILIGKLINSALLSAHGTYVAQLEVMKYLTSSEGELTQALGKALPIATQITPLFNSNLHYGQFLVTAAVPAIWQILIIAIVVIVLASAQREKQGDNWLLGINLHNVLVKLSPYALIFWLQGITFSHLLFNVLNWPMHGSWLLLITAQFLLVIACVGVGLLLFFITLDATRAMSLVAGFSAPAFAFMGITFPVTDMPFLAQFWRTLLPISHYIEIQVQQTNYGSSLVDSAGQFVALSLFIICYLIAKMILDRRKYLIKLSTQTTKSDSSERVSK